MGRIAIIDRRSWIGLFDSRSLYLGCVFCNVPQYHSTTVSQYHLYAYTCKLKWDYRNVDVAELSMYVAVEVSGFHCIYNNSITYCTLIQHLDYIFNTAIYLYRCLINIRYPILYSYRGK